jgi:hypothetical protein
MRSEVIGNLPDAFGEHRDLQFGGAGIGFVRPIFFDDSLLNVGVQHY